MRIRLTTLPRLSCHVGDRELASLPNQRRRAGLLTYLAVERETTRDLLLSIFWPDREADRARRALSQSLYEIGQDLGQEWFDAVGDRLQVRPDFEVDAVVFAAAAERGAWADALALYRGAFLDGIYLVSTTGFENWVDRRRAQLGRLHRRARRERIAELVVQGDLERGLGVAAEWSELEPLEEEAHQRAIELLCRTGQRAEAERHLEAYEKLLRREELEPLEETRVLLHVAPDARSSKPPPEPDLPTPADGEFPELLPELEVCYLAGAGSVGRVYVAREPALERLVAIKFLSAQLAGDETARRRFEREVQSAARIEHPNVATVHRFGRLASGIPYFVMAYIDGGTLEHRIAAAGALPVDEARALIGQIAAALAAAHRLGIVHRDVRPSNILYDRATQRAVLTDFGLAAVLETGAARLFRLTRPDERLGNPAYVSPEQLSGEKVNEKADVYSLGIVAFELLTGRLPFEARTVADQIKATLGGNPMAVSDLRPDVPAGLEELVRRCLASRFEHRPFAADVVRML